MPDAGGAGAEGDLIIGKSAKSPIDALVERSTRSCCCSTCRQHEATALTEAMARLPAQRTPTGCSASSRGGLTGLAVPSPR